MKDKVKVSVEIEIDPILGLDRIGNTIKDIVEYGIEDGLDNMEADVREAIKIVGYKSEDVNVNSFYPHGGYYSENIFFRDDEEFDEWLDSNELEAERIDEIGEKRYG